MATDDRAFWIRSSTLPATYQGQRGASKRRPALTTASWVGIALLIAIVGFVVAGPFLWTASPIDQNASAKLLGPSLEHPFGTDRYGRDLLARAMIGGRWTLGAAGSICLGVSVLAMLTGAIAARAHPWIDFLLCRVTESLLVIPQLVIALGLASILGPSLRNLIFALILTVWPWYALTYRTIFRQAYAEPWIESAAAMGNTPLRILVRHVLPTVVGPVAVLMSVCFGFAILNVTALSFLGLGMQPPTPEWGAMIDDARPYFQLAPMQMIVPGICIAATVLAANLTGDALRDAFDPRV
ncbi:MAG: ABC transporter permease [Thermomicrobiales bacterium]|nr:ABC transporter permease [Thermomicrobiales bacterium]